MSLDSRIHYNASLLRVLEDGRNWEYTGETVELGKDGGHCACGHYIQIAYMIRHKTDPQRPNVALGSECINHFKDINPDTFAQLQQAVEVRHQRKLEEQRKVRELQRDAEIAELQRDAEIAELHQEYVDLRTQIDAIHTQFMDANQRSPYGIWYNAVAERSGDDYFVKPYKRKTSLIKWYKEKVINLQEVINTAPPPVLPTPQPVAKKSPELFGLADRLEDGNGMFRDEIACLLREGKLPRGRGIDITIDILARQVGSAGSLDYIAESERINEIFKSVINN